VNKPQTKVPAQRSLGDSATLGTRTELARGLATDLSTGVSYASGVDHVTSLMRLLCF
jgi:hypothetical protein